MEPIVESAKPAKPKPSSASVEFVEDSVLVEVRPEAKDFIKSATGRQSTAHFVYKPTSEMVDFADRHIKEIKVSYTVTEEEWLKKQREKEKATLFRLFASAFKKLSDVKMIEGFADGTLRLKAKLNEKKSAAILSVAKDNEDGFTLQDLPSAAYLPDDQRMKDGKPVELAFEKVMNFLDERDRKVKLDVNKLKSNYEMLVAQRDKYKVGSDEYKAWDEMATRSHKEMTRQLTLQNKTAKAKGVRPSSIAPSDALDEALAESADKLGITKEARDLV